MSTTICEDHTVMMSIDYHGLDEVVDHQDCTMTRNEMRAIMVWITTLTFGDTPSQNCVTGLGKLYHLLRTSNNSITDAKDKVCGPLRNPPIDP